jgi:hypothetical protein
VVFAPVAGVWEIGCPWPLANYLRPPFRPICDKEHVAYAHVALEQGKAKGELSELADGPRKALDRLSLGIQRVDGKNLARSSFGAAAGADAHQLDRFDRPHAEDALLADPPITVGEGVAAAAHYLYLSL